MTAGDKSDPRSLQCLAESYADIYRRRIWQYFLDDTLRLSFYTFKGHIGNNKDEPHDQNPWKSLALSCVYRELLKPMSDW